MYNSLSHHMHTNNLLVPEESGFRQGSPTEYFFKLADSVLNLLTKTACGWNIL
jgi:hypothetical protein